MLPARSPALPALLALALLAGCGPELPLSPPEWSADGARIAFVRYSAEGATALFIADPGSDQTPRLVAEGVERLAVGGEKLYFLRPPVEGRKAGAEKPGLYSAKLADDGQARPELVLASGEGRTFTRVQTAPGGLLYLECLDKDGKRPLIEFDPATAKQRLVSPEAAAWRAVRLSPRGTELAAFTPGKDGGLDLVIAQFADGEPVVLGHLDRAQADGAGLLWSPTGERLLTWYTEKAGDDEEAPAGLLLFEPAKGEKGRRKLDLPHASAPVLVASFSPDGRKLCFSVMVSEKGGADDRIVTESYELDLPAGKPRLLSRAPEKLVGARAWSPDGKRYTEFTVNGLALFEAGRAEPVRLWPLDIAERTAAARAALAAAQHERAVEIVSAALDGSTATDDRAALSRLKAEALEAGGKAGDAANAYLESLLRYPVSGGREPVAQIAKRLAKYADAAPDNRLLFALAEAWKTRAAGKLDAAAGEFKDAAALANDRAWSAGLNFAAAETLLEAGKPLAAGGFFRKVSDTAEFPQNDWAGALAAAAYALAGRDDLATEEIGRCRELFPKSALAADFEAVAKAVTAIAAKPRITEEAKTADGATTARLESWPTTGLHLSFAPAKTPVGSTARVAVLRYDQWRLVLSPPEGGDKVLFDKVPAPLAKLAFSADGRRLAFLAGADDKRSLYAVDLAGGALLGDIRKLAAGETDPKTRAADYRWPDGGGLPVATKAP